MATIQILNPIYFSGNLPDIGVASVAAAATVVLKKNGQTVSTEVYTPVAGAFIVKVKYLIDSLLSVTVPASDVDLILQGASLATFELLITDGGIPVDVSFLVQKGGVDASIDTSLFLKSNFLTWQPQQKKIQYTDPEWLSYCSLQACTVKVKGYFSDLTDATIDFATLEANKAYTLNMAYPRMIAKFAKLPMYIDVWISIGDVRLSYVQRYIYTNPAVQYNDVYVFENTLGGLDTVHFLGEKKEANEIVYDAALFDETTLEYDIDISRLFTKQTGYVEQEFYRVWWLEFFKSLQRYHISEGALKRIVVSKPKLESVAGTVNSYEFTFAYALQTKYISLPRLDALPALVDIVDPDGQLFFLAPRLAQFPVVSAVDNPLFLVQLPFSSTWSVMSLASITEAMGAGTGPGDYYSKDASNLRYKPINYSPDLSSYSTKTEADLLYRPMSYFPDLSAYSTKLVADGLYRPIGYAPDLSGYSTKAQADLLYRPIGYAPDLSGYVLSSALETWTGSEYITQIGTIATGVWHGSKIDDAYLASTFLKSETDTLDSVLERGNTTARSIILSNGGKTFTLSVDVSGNLSLNSNTANTAIVTGGDMIAYAGANPVVSWWDALGGFVDGTTMKWIGGKLVSVASGSGAVDVNVSNLNNYYVKTDSDLRYRPVTYAPDLSSYSTKVVADTLYRPIAYTPDLSAYSTKSVADTLYRPIGYSPDLSGYVLSTDGRMTNSRVASDVYAWAKSSVKPAYAWSEIVSRPTNLTDFTNNLGNYGAWITEITSANVTTALGYTPLSLSGGTLTGPLSGTNAVFSGNIMISHDGYLHLNGGIDNNWRLGVNGTTYDIELHGSGLDTRSFRIFGGAGSNIDLFNVNLLTGAAIFASTGTFGSTQDGNGGILIKATWSSNPLCVIPTDAFSIFSGGGTYTISAYNRVNGLTGINFNANSTTFSSTVDNILNMQRSGIGSIGFNMLTTGAGFINNRFGGKILSFTDGNAISSDVTFSSTVQASQFNSSGSISAGTGYTSNNGGTGIISAHGSSVTASGIELNNWWNGNRYPSGMYAMQGNLFGVASSMLQFRTSYWNGSSIVLVPGMTIHEYGDVLIPNMLPSTSSTTGALVVSGGVGIVGALYVGGAITATGDVIAFSDGRLKININPLQNSLAKVIALNGISFQWNGIGGRETIKTHPGYIAQDLAKILPEIVTKDASGYLGIAYQKVIPYLSCAVRELNFKVDTEVDQLKRRITTLESEVKQLRRN